MPKQVEELQNFNQGTITTPSERDIPIEAAAYSLNLDPLTEDGKLTGVPEDRLVASLSNNIPFEPLNYGLQWGASAIRIADLTQMPPATTDGNGSRVIFQGTRGINEVLKYTSSYFDTSQIKDTLLNVEEGIGDTEVSGEISTSTRALRVIDFSSKRTGLINPGDVIALSSETDVANIPKSIEWMRVTEVEQLSNTIFVDRGHYNTTPVKYTSLSTNTNIYKLSGVLGWLNVTGWQTHFKNNHIGQNPCIIYVANAGATSADNLTHDAANKTITITQNSLVNNLGANDSLEDLVRNNDVIKIINASGGVATVKIDYVTDGVINYSSISGSLSTQTSGSYWIDCNKIANGNFRAYDTSADGKTPYGWTTTINPSGTATYDDVYADDTKSIGSPQLSTTGGITGLKGNERDTSNSNYDSTESPFLILSNARDISTSVNSITLTDAITKDGNKTRFRVSNPSLITEGDTLVLSHGVGVKITDGGGDVYTGVDANPYLQNHYNPGYLYEALNVASFSDNETVVINIPSSIGGSGEDITFRFEDTSSDTLTTAGANRIISISNEDAAGANASDAQLAINIVAAINGCPDVQRVTYGTTDGTGDTITGVAGLSAAVNSETNTKVDIWPVNGVAEEYVKVESVEVSEDAGGDAQPGYINVKRAYHGNLQAHSAGTSIKRILRTQIKQTVGASGFDSVQEGKKYKLTWWVADVTKAWLGNNDYHLKPRLNFKVGCAGGFLLGGEDWSSDKSIVGANGEKAWLNSLNYSTIVDGNTKTAKGDFGGSLYHTWAGNKDITNASATGWVRGVVANNYQVGRNNMPNIGSSISFVQDSGTTHNGNWTLGDATNENFANIEASSKYITSSTALLHLNGAIHDKSIIGIPNTNGDLVYYAGWQTALVTDSDGLSGETTETTLNSNGSNPIRKAYVEFEDYVGDNTTSTHQWSLLTTPEFFISSADGMFALFRVPTSPNSSGFKDGKSYPTGNTVSNASLNFTAGAAHAKYRTYFLVPTDGAEVGAYKTLPTQISGGGTWAGDGTDSMSGAVLATGIAYAKALKECIETAFNNVNGDGVTRFNVHRDGAKLCIEDAIGGEISQTWKSNYINNSGELIESYQNGVALFSPFNNDDSFSEWNTNGKMHFKFNINNRDILDEDFSQYRWASSIEDSGRNILDGALTGHKGYLKGDGLGFNLGAITEGGGYPAGGSDINPVCQFLTCYHIGATPNAAEGATNLDLAIEHANGQNGLITGAVANTDELTLTRTDITNGGQVLDISRFPDKLENDSSTMFSIPSENVQYFEFYTGVNNSDTGSGKTILWHKCEFAFTLPDDKDISTLDVYFESDGEVWGTRDGGTIGGTVLDKYSSLIGIDSISLVEDVEVLPSAGVNSNITSSATMKDEENKDLLIYYNKNQSTINVLEDFGDPLEGHLNLFKTDENFPYSAETGIIPNFVKNNREFHIGMGPNKPSIWAGFLNHKQFGNSLLDKFVIDTSEIGTYDSQGAYTMDKICQSGFWLVENVGSTAVGGVIHDSGTRLRLHIPRNEHYLETGDKLIVKGVSSKKTHQNSGAHSDINDTSIYDATCLYMHPYNTGNDTGYNDNDHPKGAKIIEITDEYLEVDASDLSYTFSSDVSMAFQVYPAYYYGIARDSFNIFRIDMETGEVTKGELSFKAQSICASYSQNEDEVGGTMHKFKGGRVWIAEKLAGLIHEVNVATTKWENFSKSATVNPVWSTWWSSTEENADLSNVTVKTKPPTDRGHISDIIQTWGLKGSTDSLENDSDSRLWIQFYPNSGNSFGPLDNFIYCGNVDKLQGSSTNHIYFANRTIPLNHTGGGTQEQFDPHNRYGKRMNELAQIGSNLGGANDTLSMKSRLIAKTKITSQSHSPTFTRNLWFTPETINNTWVSNPNITNKYHSELHFRRTNGEWEYDKANTWVGGGGFRNYAENIGWDSDTPEFKVIRYGLVALADNDFDGVIDGTGLPVASAANINAGFENGKNCSSHAAAVLMQTDAKWIMNGNVAMAQSFNACYQEWRSFTMGVNHGGVGYRYSEEYVYPDWMPEAWYEMATHGVVGGNFFGLGALPSASTVVDGTFNKSVELFKPDTFFMVTSDIWKMEKADGTSNHEDNTNANSKGAWLIPDNGSYGGKFSHASKSNDSRDGKLEHWSSSDGWDDNASILKDRVHLFRTADKHHLSIGDNILFKGPNWRTDHASAVFSNDNYARSPEYAGRVPVVGIVDEYHVLVNITHNGQGTGNSANGSNTNHLYVGGSTYVEHNTDVTPQETGIGESFMNWKVGGSEWLPAYYSGNDTQVKEMRFFGGRVPLHDEKIEGSGMKFFSDGNWLGNFHFSHAHDYAEDTASQRPQGVHVFQTSLLSFCHARMIRPLGDLDVSGVANFNIDNSISLWMPTMPMGSPGLTSFDFRDSSYSVASKSILGATKLYMTQASEGNTKLYSFDWSHLMPDTNRATFDGVDYTETTSMHSSHRTFGTYELGDRNSDKRRTLTDMTNSNMHASNSHHESAKGRFRLAGDRLTQSADTGIDGAVAGPANKQNFMIPGGFMIKAGANNWNGDMLTYFDEAMSKTGKAGIVLGGSAQGLAHNAAGFYRPNGSLFSSKSHNTIPFYIRKGALNDLVAIYSYISPQRELKHKNTDADKDLNPEVNPFWTLGLHKTVARKVISSYATTGGYGTRATTTVPSDKEKITTFFVGHNRWIVAADGDVHDSLAAKGYDGDNMLVHINNSYQPWDPVTGEIFVRTHYPLPATPGVNAGESVTFIQSRDAALCPVRLDLDVLPPYHSYTGPGDKAIVRVEGKPNDGQIKITVGSPVPSGFEGNVGVIGNNESEGEYNNNWYLPTSGDRIKITETQSYNGEYILDSNEGYKRLANGYTGTNSEAERGRIEIIHGRKANPLTITGLQGITLGGNIQYHNNDTMTTFESDRTPSFWHKILGVAKSGSFKIGFLDKFFGTSFSDTANSTVSSRRYGHYNYSNSWTESVDSQLASENHLFQADIGFIIEPGSASGAGAANFNEFGDYKYKVSLVYDGYQEGPLSENHWGIDSLDTGVSYNSYNITLTIKDPSPRLTSVCLYRKNNENDLYRLVDEVTTDSTKWKSLDTSHTITIEDDGGLQATFESRAGYSEFLTNPFVNYGIGAEMGGYHFVANCSHPQIKDASHMIFRSLPGMFDLFNWANDYLTLPTKPTAMANFAGRLYVFDEINTYRINPQTLVIEDTFHGSGCVGMQSLIITDYGMFYCDRKNAYMHNGSNPTIISTPIKKGGGSDISSFNISDLSWEKTAGNNKSMNPLISFDNKRNSILFFVEKTGDEKVSHSRYYCWAYSIMQSRWDLWEVSTGDDGTGTFDSSKVTKPSSVVTTTDGKTFVTMDDLLIDYLGGTNTKPWQFLSKKLTAATQSQKKVWKNIKLIGNDDDVTTVVGDAKGSISIAVDDTVIENADRAFTKDSPDGKITIKGTSKTGRYLQFLLTQMEDSIDAIGIVFRRKGVK